MTTARRSKAKRKKKRAPPACPRCGHGESIKSGIVQGEQRWKCKECAYQYTRTGPRGRPLWQKSLAVFLYSYGVSMHAISRIFQVQPSTVLKWVRIYAKDFHGAKEPGNISLMELGEMKRLLRETASQSSGVLCIAIGDALFTKSMGITITPR